MKTKVRELRLQHDLTQQQLADMVHVTARTILSIEKGQYSPSLMLGLPDGAGVRRQRGGALLPERKYGNGG